MDGGEDTLSSDEREALLSIAHGAVVTSGGLSIQRLCAIALEAILTRGLGPGLYGVYAFGWRLTTMCLRFANLGADTTLQRDLPANGGSPQRQRRSLGLSYLTTLLTSLTIAALLILGAEWLNRATIDEPAFPTALRLFALLLVAIAIVRMHAATLKAAKSANGEVLLNRIVYPGSRLAAGLVAIGLGLSIEGVVGALVIVVGVIAVLAFPVTVRVVGVRPTITDLRREAVSFYDHAVPSALSRVGGLLRTRVDVLLIGLLLTATAAGIYNVVLVLVAIAAIPLHAFNQLMPPVASHLYAAGKTATLNDVYTTITRLIVTATVPLMACLVVFGPALLGIFGEEFKRGYAVLLVFLVGRFIGNAVGATGILMSMTNNHYPKMILEWLLAALNLVLTYVFVLQFGLIGAALGTSVAIGVQNLLQAVLLYRFEGLWPFDPTFLKPLTGGVVMIGPMAGVNHVLADGYGIPIGACVGLLVYGLALRVQGLPASDRLLIRELWSSYRRQTRRRWQLVQGRFA